MFKTWKRSGEKGDGQQYRDAKKGVKRFVAMAMDRASRETVAKVDSNRDGLQLFRIASQRVKERCDVLRVNCLKDEKGVVKVTVGKHKKDLEESRLKADECGK